MIVYNKFGYQIQLFTKENAKDLFQYIIKYKIKNDETPEERLHKRKELKKDIREQIEDDRYTPLGVYSGSRLIGICFSEMMKENNNVAKISYIKMDEEEHKTKAPMVLFYFLIDKLYQEIPIVFKNKMLDNFGDIVRVYPKILGISSFREDFITRIKKYFEEN